MKSSSNAIKISNLGLKNNIKIKRTTETDEKKIGVFSPSLNKWQDPGTGFDKALNDLLPRFEYVDTRKHFDDVSSYKKTTPMGIMLSSLLTDIMEKDTEYARFKSDFDNIFNQDDENSGIRKRLNEVSEKLKGYLQKQFPDANKVNTNIPTPELDDLFKSFSMEIDDGINTKVCDKGDGMQRALMLAIIRVYADFRGEQELNKNNLFFIDEAEVHLHPSAQRKLKEALLDLAKKGDQVFINTHSSVLISEENEIQAIYKVNKRDKETNCQRVVENQKPDIIFELLGGSPADLLLPNNFLIVEGYTEYRFLTDIIDKFYVDKPKIQIIKADGDINKVRKSFSAVVEMFKPLQKSIYADKAVAIFDSCTSDQLNSFMSNTNTQEGEQVFNLPVDSIEEYYPESWKRFPQGMAGEEKVALASLVAENIQREDFERKMPLFFNALSKCWEKSFTS